MAATRDYVIKFRRDTTVRTACEDAGCEAFRNGWETVCDQRTPLGLEQAAYIRQRSGRTFTELSGTPTVFRFEPGQRCFAEHRTRPARFLAGGVQLPDLPAWVGDLDQHVSNLEDQARKG
jgi:hypothetical protein